MRIIDADALLERWCSEVCKAKPRCKEDCMLYDYLTIDSLSPTIEIEQQWIPCSERFPEENEVVLTQARFSDDIKMAVSARIDYNYWTGWGTREVNVVAWMPLPPVYHEDDNK